jgi:hypothetical protein
MVAGPSRLMLRNPPDEGLRGRAETTLVGERLTMQTRLDAKTQLKVDACQLRRLRLASNANALLQEVCTLILNHDAYGSSATRLVPMFRSIAELFDEDAERFLSAEREIGVAVDLLCANTKACPDGSDF